LAVAIYAYILWVALGLLYPRPAATSAASVRRFAWGVTGLVFLMILSGGFVAGTKAGFLFNTFPLMNGRFFPEGLYALQPWWTNLFENHATVQFNHRILAYVLIGVVAAFWLTARRALLPARARRALHSIPVLLALQVALGVATLLYVVPLPLAAAHQAGALVLLTTALYLNHALRRG
jgi:cytochrome c oxidase assembly protein subunit 15